MSLVLQAGCVQGEHLAYHQARAKDAAMTSPKRLIVSVGLIGFGFSADRLLAHQPGIGFPLLTVLSLSLFWATDSPPRPDARWMLGAALSVTMFAAVRTSAWLLLLDMATAWVLTAAAATFASAGDVVHTTIGSWLVRPLIPLGGIGRGIRLMTPRMRIRSPGRKRAAVLGTAAIAGSVMFVFGVVLASADPVFASFVGQPFHVSLDQETLFHIGASLSIAVGASAILATARRAVTTSPSMIDPTHGAHLDGWSWTTILAAASAVFALFLGIHLPAMYLGHDQALAQLGLTPAAYAREGYAQMVIAAILTLALVGAAWIGGGAKSRAARWTAVGLASLNLIVLASAFHRLGLYESAFGWTGARLLGHVGIIWLAAVLVALVVGLVRRDLGWIATFMVAGAVIALIGLNLLNPDATIAANNLRRAGDVDVAYLGHLSADAVPTIVDMTATNPDLAPTVGMQIRRSGLCDAPSEPWYSFNVAARQARTAAAPYC